MHQRVVEPERHVAAPLQSGFVGRPARDALARFRDAVTTGCAVLDRQFPGSSLTPIVRPPATSIHQRSR